jgi:hypothetical protein
MPEYSLQQAVFHTVYRYKLQDKYGHVHINVRAFVLDVLGKQVMGCPPEILAKENRQTRVCTYMDG